MKKIMLITVLILFITNNVMAQSTYTDELIDMASVVQENDLNVESWQVVLKENMEHETLEETVEKLKDSYLVTRTEDENSIKYSFEDVHKTGDVIEQYNAIFPKNPLYQAELVTVLEGNSWDATIQKQYKEKLSYIKGKYFTESVQIYACLSTTDNAIINSNYFVSNIVEKLEVKNIEEQKDTVLQQREIIYGYTSQWGQKITIENKPVNIQIVVENADEDNEKYTIGTPILINEY